MSITKKYKRFLALGCSHGIYADPLAIEAVLKFRKNFKPHEVIHLGDFCDMSPFMGSSDNGKGDPIKPDLLGGIEFLKQLEPTHILAGNHEARLWRDLQSTNELKVFTAEACIEAITTTALKLHATFTPYTGVWQAVKLGNFTFTHGTVYNENSARDMAEMYGNVIFAHTHKPSLQNGRRIDHPVGISVGTLTKRGALEYANIRRATLAWGQGFVYGEYTDDKLYPRLFTHDYSDKWNLPA